MRLGHVCFSTHDVHPTPAYATPPAGRFDEYFYDPASGERRRLPDGGEGSCWAGRGARWHCRCSMRAAARAHAACSLPGAADMLPLQCTSACTQPLRLHQSAEVRKTKLDAAKEVMKGMLDRLAPDDMGGTVCCRRHLAPFAGLCWLGECEAS